jgi:hypothetical protein
MPNNARLYPTRGASKSPFVAAVVGEVVDTMSSISASSNCGYYFVIDGITSKPFALNAAVKPRAEKDAVSPWWQTKCATWRNEAQLPPRKLMD